MPNHLVQVFFSKHVPFGCFVLNNFLKHDFTETAPGLEIKLFRNGSNRVPKDNIGVENLNFFTCYVGQFQNV